MKGEMLVMPDNEERFDLPIRLQRGNETEILGMIIRELGEGGQLIGTCRPCGQLFSCLVSPNYVIDGDDITGIVLGMRRHLADDHGYNYRDPWLLSGPDTGPFDCRDVAASDLARPAVVGPTAHCTRCDRDVSVSDFTIRANGRPQSWCRPCHAAYARERRTNGSRTVPIPFEASIDYVPPFGDETITPGYCFRNVGAYANGNGYWDSTCYSDVTGDHAACVSGRVARITQLNLAPVVGRLIDPEDLRPARRRRGPVYAPTVATLAAGTHPAMLERRFGVEIECACSLRMSDAAEQLRELGLDVEEQGYNHAVSTGWKIVPDGSVDSGFEVVSPILSGREGRANLRKMMEGLRTIGATVNSTCGLHVHHDVTDFTGGDFYRLVRLWQASQPVIDGLVAPSRRSGRSEWCRNVSQAEVMAAERLFTTYGSTVPRYRDTGTYLCVDRYRTLNLASYPRQGTVEIRQHQGTLNATKALAWVAFGQAMIEWALTLNAESNETAQAVTLPDLMEVLEGLGMESTTTAYLLDRGRRFARETISR